MNDLEKLRTDYEKDINDNNINEKIRHEKVTTYNENYIKKLTENQNFDKKIQEQKKQEQEQKKQEQKKHPPFELYTYINTYINTHMKFIYFTLFEEYVNSDIGAVSEDMYKVFHYYMDNILNNNDINEKNLKDSFDIKHDLLKMENNNSPSLFNFLEGFIYGENNKNNIFIFDFVREKHSMKIIYDKTINSIIFVNSGLGLNLGNNNIYFIKQLTTILSMDIMKIFNHICSLRTIREVYIFLEFSEENMLFRANSTLSSEPRLISLLSEKNIGKKNINIQYTNDVINNITRNLKSFEKDNCKQQLSGSCTYFSILYSFYYLIYRMDTINDKKNFIDKYIENIRKKIIEVLKNKNYNIDNENYNILKQCVRLINVKYEHCIEIEKLRNSIDIKNVIPPEKITPINIKFFIFDDYIKNNDRYYINLELWNFNLKTSTMITIEYLKNYYSDCVYNRKKIDIYYFLILLCCSDENQKLKFFYKYYDELDYSKQYNISIIFFIIYTSYAILGHNKIKANCHEKSYVLLIILRLFEITGEKLKLDRYEKNDIKAVDIDEKIDYRKTHLFFLENSSYISASSLLKKFNKFLEITMFCKLSIDNYSVDFYPEVIYYLMNKISFEKQNNNYSKDYSLIFRLVNNSDEVKNFSGDGFVISVKKNFFLGNGSYIFVFKHGNKYYVPKYYNDEFTQINFPENSIEVKNVNKVSTGKNLFTNSSNCYNIQINNFIRIDTDISYINPFKLTTENINEGEMGKKYFSFLLNNKNIIFDPRKKIEKQFFKKDWYSNFESDTDNFYYLSKEIFLNNMKNIKLSDCMEINNVVNKKNYNIMFIIYIYYIFYGLDKYKSNDELYIENVETIKKNAAIMCVNPEYELFNVFFDEEINDNYQKYVDNINKVEKTFIILFIMKHVFSRINKLFNISKHMEINKNLKIIQSENYDFVYDFKGKKYYTKNKCDHIMMDDMYIKYYDENDNIYYFSQIAPDAFYDINNGYYIKYFDNNEKVENKKNENYYYNTGVRYEYDIGISKMKSISFMAKNSKKIVQYYELFEYNTKKQYYTLYASYNNDNNNNNEKLYIFGSEEPVKYYNNRKNMIILKNKLLIFNDKFKSEENFFGIKYDEQNKKSYIDDIESLYYFEYNIKYDNAVDEIVDIEFNDEIYAEMLFKYLNHCMDYKLLMKYLNKFTSLIGVMNIYDTINHPNSLLFINVYKKLYNLDINIQIEKFNLVLNNYKKANIEEKDFFYCNTLLNYYYIINKDNLTKEYYDANFHNNNTTDKIFTYKPLQKGYVDEICKYIESDDYTNPTYEIIMGFGKSSIIIPKSSLYTLFFSKKYDQIIVISPINLTNELYTNILKNTINLPLCVVLKENEYFYSESQKRDTNGLIKGIKICSDVTMKFSLLKSNDYGSNFMYKNDRRIFIIDEIDACINPLKSNFNFKIGKPIILNQLLLNQNINPTQLEKFYKFIIEYVKNLDAIDEKIKNNFNDIYDKLKCIFQNCSKIELDGEINVNDKIFYLLKKIYDASFILKSKKYIINKHYGFDTLSKTANRFFYACPYEYINMPAKDSDFNDIYIIIMLTVNLYINPNFNFRIDDVFKINNFVLNKKTEKNDIENFIIRKFVSFMKQKKNIDKFNSEIKNRKDEMIEYYLINIVLPNIQYNQKYLNTSFLELLNKKVVDKYVCFSGTTEYIGKLYNKLPKNCKKFPSILDNNKEIKQINKYREITQIKKYKYKELDYYSVVNFFNNKTFGQLSERNIYNYIKNTPTIKCIIDTACIFRFKNTEEYSRDILINIPNIDYVLFFDSNDDLLKYDRNGGKISKEKKHKTENELKIMEKENFLIFYDDKHTRGTDVNLPINTHGVCTISQINDNVGVMQGIYRLRQLGKGQTVEFFINDELRQSVGENLFKYLQDNTNKYIIDQEKELILQTISANIKFRTGNYVNIEYNIPLIPDNLDKKIGMILSRNYNSLKIYETLCKSDNYYCYIFSENHLNEIEKFDASISVSVSDNTSTQINTQINTQMNTDIVQNIARPYIDYKNEVYDDNKTTYFPFLRLPHELGYYYEKNLLKYQYTYKNKTEAHSYFSLYSYTTLANDKEKFLLLNDYKSPQTGDNKYEKQYYKYIEKINKLL